MFTLILFSGSLLSGIGLSKFIELKNKKIKFISIIMFAVSFILAVTIIDFSHFSSSFKALVPNIIFPSIILGALCGSCIIYIVASSWKKREKLVEKLFLLFIITLTFFALF